MSNKITGKITGKTPNKITNKITGKITGKNFTGSGAGSFKAVLLAVLVFSLVGVANSLQAQEGEKAGKQTGQQGWFVGVSPFVMDVKLKKTSRITGEERTVESEVISEVVAATSYDATVPNFYSDATTHRWRFGGNPDNDGNPDNLATVATAIGHARSLCQSGAIPTFTMPESGFFKAPTVSLISYATTDNFTGDIAALRQLLIDTPATAIDINSTTDQAAAVPLCKAFFESALSPSAPMTTLLPGKPPEKLPDKTSEETSKLKGTGISFGFNFEKYSLSFNQLQWSAGDDKLQAQVLLARYFLPYGLSVGGGLASAKLGTVFGSASGTAPALHFAYNRAITKNLQVEVGLFWLGLDLAVQDAQIISTPTITTSAPITTVGATIQRRAILGLVRLGGTPSKNYRAVESYSGSTPYDTRIVVTAKIPSGVNRTTTTSTTKTVTREHHQTAEIKNPASISIKFIWRFR